MANGRIYRERGEDGGWDKEVGMWTMASAQTHYSQNKIVD